MKKEGKHKERENKKVKNAILLAGNIMFVKSLYTQILHPTLVHFTYD